MPSRMIRRRAVAGAVLGGVFAGLLAGAPPARASLSLDEAIKIIDQFRADAAPPAAGQAKGQSAGPGQAQPAPAPVAFVPPPRTISDITAILDKQKPDPAKRAAATAAADRPPPAGASDADLAEFYYRRGQAAEQIGRTRQQLEDMKKAYALGQQARMTPGVLNFYLQQIGLAYWYAGDVKGALATQEQRLDLMAHSSNAPRGMIFNIYQQKIQFAVRSGQLDIARDALRKSENELNEAAGWRMPTQLNREVFRSSVLRSRATYDQEIGRYADAEAAIRENIDLVTGRILPHASELQNPPGTWENVRDQLHSELSRVLLLEGRPVEAEAEVRRALLSRLQLRGHYAPETGSDVLYLAHVLYAQGRYAEAEKLAAAARDIFENLGQGKGSHALAMALRVAAQAQAAQGNTEGAQATYEALEGIIGDDAVLRRQFLDTNPGYALALLRAHRGADAVKVMENVVAVDQKNLGDKAYATAQARGYLGLVLARLGQTDKAAQQFTVAMPILTTSSREASDSDDDGSSVAERDRQLQLVTEAYLGLLADTRGSAAAAETFHLAEAVRGRSVERALAESAARSAISDPRLADLARHEQDAQKQTAALQGLLTNILSQPTSSQDPGAVQKLRQQIDHLRDARARVREEIEGRFPDYANLIDPRPATVEQAQKNLRPGEALIATYVGSERLFVWAVPHQGPAAFASTKVTEREVAKMVTDLRKALDPNASTLDEVPAFDVALANKLYGMVLKPVEAGWSSAQSLLIVPHKALGQIPLALLVTQPTTLAPKGKVLFAEYKDVPFLVRKVAVAQLPAVASLSTLRALPAPKGTRQMFIGFGDPWFSPAEEKEARAEQASDALQTRGVRKAPKGLQTRGIPLHRRSAPKTEGVDSAELAQLPRLPDTAEEVKSIALALHADLASDVFLGAAANEKTVETADLANRRIIVFATHGLVPGDLNGLTQPALALSSPDVAHVPGDGLLTVDKILGLKLNADWVVLSACNTASGQGAGAEAVSGLGRAFFYAGTRALLVSNWPVETVSARTLTTDLFRRQADDPKIGRSEALRQAELALISGPGYVDPDTKQPVFSYAHPIFWAPFTVVGDGGTTIQ